MVENHLKKMKQEQLYNIRYIAEFLGYRNKNFSQLYSNLFC